MRRDIAECSGLLRSISYAISVHKQDYTKYIATSEHLQRVQRVNNLVPLIRLRLNPDGEIDQNIIYLLSLMPSRSDNPKSERLAKLDDLLVRHSQWLLKGEWENVKAEATGIVFRLWLEHVSEKRRLRSYRGLAEEEGSVVQVK